jgi:protein phosphatase
MATPPICHVDCFGLTDAGKTRPANEDHFVIASMRKSVRVRHTSLEDQRLDDRLGGPEAYLFAVADGVGGRAGGRQASSTTVGMLLEYLGEAAGCYHSFDVDVEHEFLERIEYAIRRAHDRLLGEQGDGQKNPATTVTLAMLLYPRAYVVHVGDSRAYVLRNDRLRQLTRDQTIGEYMVSAGAWTEAQAAKAGAGGALSSAVGGSELSPSIGLIDLEVGDVLLLCTDGISKHVPDDQMAALLAQPADAESICRQLADRALGDGGTDNLTVIVARMRPSEPG